MYHWGEIRLEKYNGQTYFLENYCLHDIAYPVLSTWVESTIKLLISPKFKCLLATMQFGIFKFHPTAGYKWLPKVNQRAFAGSKCHAFWRSANLKLKLHECFSLSKRNSCSSVASSSSSVCNGSQISGIFALFFAVWIKLNDENCLLILL